MNVFEIRPEVWTCDPWPAILVCNFNRWKGPLVMGAKNPNMVESIIHPVAIQLTVPPVICFGFSGGKDGTHEVWTRHKPEEMGIPCRAASLALGEAFRCIPAKLDPFSRHMDATITADMLDRRGGAIRRNILIWLAWGHWQASGKTFEQRRAEIEALGFTLSPKAFRRLLENAGMSIC